nr:MAG TPA: hypothetical protein [Caudoviricetes sp.]
MDSVIFFVSALASLTAFLNGFTVPSITTFSVSSVSPISHPPPLY